MNPQESVLKRQSANTGHFGLMLGGRILMGFGSTVIEGTQNKLFAHWFHGSQLGLAFGLDIAWNRITGIIARSTAVPLSNIDGWWGWALWIPTIVCAVNLCLVIVYWAFERAVPKTYRPVLGKEAYQREGWAKRKFPMKSLLEL
jgi:MFS family permease